MFRELKRHGRLADAHQKLAWTVGVQLMLLSLASLAVLMAATEGDEPEVSSFIFPVWILVLYIAPMCIRIKVHSTRTLHYRLVRLTDVACVPGDADSCFTLLQVGAIAPVPSPVCHARQERTARKEQRGNWSECES